MFEEYIEIRNSISFYFIQLGEVDGIEIMINWETGETRFLVIGEDETITSKGF